MEIISILLVVISGISFDKYKMPLIVHRGGCSLDVAMQSVLLEPDDISSSEEVKTNSQGFRFSSVSVCCFLQVCHPSTGSQTPIQPAL